MMTDSNHPLEFALINTEKKSEQTISTLSFLLFDFKTFRDEVVFVGNNSRGLDYFNILEKISDLQFLIESVINKLKIQVGDLDKVPYRTLSNSLDYPIMKSKVEANSDEDAIKLILLRLKTLIISNRKASLEAKELEEFLIESLLLEFDKELEKSKWIFYLFSKY